MVLRVLRALMAVGLVFVVVGLAYGLWRVGDGCGSAFSPEPNTVTQLPNDGCAEALAGRVNQAWLLIILGVGALSAAVGFGAPTQPSSVPVPEAGSAAE